MNQEVDIYTETMAKVFAAQGHWEKVAEIYRHLLATEPERLNFADALAEAENKIEESRHKNPDQLIPLFSEWFELLFKVEALQKLKKWKKGG
jgi:regulator of sigma D